jgi:hypothetical protein
MSTPTLRDDRVEKMRMSVMHRIDQDVTRRGTRTRTAIGLAAAGVVVIGLGGYAAGTLGGSHYEVSGAPDRSRDSSDSAGAAAPQATALGETSESQQGELAEKRASGPERQVVTTGTVSVTVARPRTTVQRFGAWIESIGGRVDERSENGSGDDAYASVTVRVPSTSVTETIDRLRTYGRVDDVSLQNSDVTAQARDLDARIDALQLSIDRLTAILADTASSKDVIEAEGALTQRQEQLESLQAERKAIADQVSLSTVTITFSQKATADSVEPSGFTGGLRDGWNGLVATVNRVVELAGVLLPWAAIAAVVGLLARLVVRRRVRG